MQTRGASARPDDDGYGARGGRDGHEDYGYGARGGRDGHEDYGDHDGDVVRGDQNFHDAHSDRGEAGETLSGSMAVRAWGVEPGSPTATTGTWAQAQQPHPGGGYPVAPPSRTPKRMVPLWAAVVAAGAGLGVGAAAGAAKGSTSGAADAVAAPSVSVSVSVSVSPSPVVTTVVVPADAPPATTADAATASSASSSTDIPGDGTYLVGTDIKPGLYRTTGPSSSEFPNCYWERDRDLNNGLDSIIANDNTQGRATVQIRASDAAFKTTGCADWVKIG